MQSRKTHFEQVPVEFVKQIAERFADHAATSSLGSLKEERSGREGDCSTRIGAFSDEILRYPEWQRSYRDALLELDEGKLKERIALAETAISNRLRHASLRSPDTSELRAIDDALACLRLLKNS
jgi:hypothetical protein